MSILTKDRVGASLSLLFRPSPSAVEMSSTNLADFVQKLKVLDRALEAFEGDHDIFEALSAKRRKWSELIAAETELPQQICEHERHGDKDEWWHGGEGECWRGDEGFWSADKPSEKVEPPTVWNVVPQGAASSSADGATRAIGSGTKVVGVTSMSDKDSESYGEKSRGPVIFDGAAASQLTPDVFRCCDCRAGNALITDLAYLHDDNTPVVEQGGNNRMARVSPVQQGESLPWKNCAVKAQDESMRLVCLHGCGRYHRTRYLQENGKPNSAWAWLRKQSFGWHKNCPSAVKMLCEIHGRKLKL